MTACQAEVHRTTVPLTTHGPVARHDTPMLVILTLRHMTEVERWKTTTSVYRIVTANRRVIGTSVSTESGTSVVVKITEKKNTQQPNMKLLNTRSKDVIGKNPPKKEIN